MEYWDVYDKDGNFTGKVVEKNSDFLPGEYHKAVEIWIVNDNGLLLVQRRSGSVEILSRVLGTYDRQDQSRRNTRNRLRARACGRTRHNRIPFRLHTYISRRERNAAPHMGYIRSQMERQHR